MFSAVGLVGCGGSGIRTAGGGTAGVGGGMAPSADATGGRGGGLAGTTGQGGGARAGASGEAGGVTGRGGALGHGGSGEAGGATAGAGSTGGAAASAGGAGSSGGVPGGGAGGRPGGSMDGTAGGISSTGGASGRGGVGGGFEGGGGGAGGAAVTASCEGTAPCGGSLVGSWRFVSICLDEASITGASDQILAGCQGATITDVATSHSGSIAFTASDYTGTATTTLSFTLTLPLSCVGGAAHCADIGDRLASTPSIVSASCSGATVCTCALANPPVITNTSGTYLTSGTAVTFLPDSGAPSSSTSYCVKADQLHILDVETLTSMGSLIMRTRSDEVADRQ